MKYAVIYSQIIFNLHKPFIRVCLVHIVATNLSIWLSTTTHETAEDIGRAVAKERNLNVTSFHQQVPIHGGTAAPFVNQTTDEGTNIPILKFS